MAGNKIDSITSYGFGQMGSAHCKTDASVYPPHGMVIVAIQFLAANTPTILKAATDETGARHEFFEIGAAANDSLTVKTITNATGGNVTVAAGTAIPIQAFSAGDINVGDFVQITGTIPAGQTNLLLARKAKVTVANAGANQITLDQPIIHATGAATSLVFHPSSPGRIGQGGEDAAANVYPKGMIIYGRWDEVRPSADDDGGIICYFGY